MNTEIWKKYRLFLIILVYFIVTGGMGLNIYLNSKKPQPHDVLIWFLLAFLLTHISIVDSKIEGKPLPVFSYFFVLILYPIAVPICIIRAHGIRKGIKIIILHLVGLFLVLLTISVAFAFLLDSGN